MKRGDTAQGYNCQIVTENQIIIGNYVAGKPGDLDTLIPTLNKIKNKFKRLPKQILADKGYGSEENYTYLENEKVDSYIPHIQGNKVNLDNYIFDNQNDTYEDKEGNIFKFKQFVGSLKGRKQGRLRLG